MLTAHSVKSDVKEMMLNQLIITPTVRSWAIKVLKENNCTIPSSSNWEFFLSIPCQFCIFYLFLGDFFFSPKSTWGPQPASHDMPRAFCGLETCTNLVLFLRRRVRTQSTKPKACYPPPHPPPPPITPLGHEVVMQVYTRTWRGFWKVPGIGVGGRGSQR